MTTPQTLPVDGVLPELVAALGDRRRAVLHAPPGAGKTTRVPPALLRADWLAGRVVMLEPRRVAARAAAARIASELGSRVGDLVGHRVRNDTRVGPDTRIEVVTEGVLTRMLQDDPSLPGVGVVVFDEFHERSLHADLGLALTIEAQTALRPDLAILVMSATLDDRRIAGVLGGAPVIRSEGRRHRVETRHRPRRSSHLEDDVASAIEHAVGHDGGDILAFLPGARWIRRTAERLAGRVPGGVILPLHGSLDGAEQDRALAPDPHGRRKVVLATDIAETSLTIDGVRIVVDGGQRRAPRFDPRSGLTRLETGRISVASADQRRGRAGRQAPGVCYRLWSESDQQHMAEFDPPEIAVADLSGLRLQLAAWGATADELTWIDRPPSHALAEAEVLLGRLGGLDATGRLTAHGREMVAFAAEPRLAHMMLRGRALGLGGLACDVAALLSGRDPSTSRHVDLRDRVLDLRRGGGAPALREARDTARRWRRELGVGEGGDTDDTGLVIALGFPDRIGQQRGSPTSYRLASGRGAELPSGDPLTGSAWLGVADVDGEPAGGRIHLAAPIEPEALTTVFADDIEVADHVVWDERRGDVSAERQSRIGSTVLKREPIDRPDPTALAGAWAAGIASEGLSLLPWPDGLQEWRDRVAFLRRIDGEDWPDLGDDALVATTSAWLAPHLVGVRRRRDLGRLDLSSILRSQLGWEQQRRLDEWAPTHLTVPSGSNVRLDYGAEDGPVLAVRLQELFGLTDTPLVAGGRVPVVVHLLSPAQRPVQVTRDLASFWRETYPQVKGELMGRYPKHQWPDDPLTAEATNRTKKQRR
ncbi:MAG: ATP-dependent helicase HrpB [Actinomycetota bacterium]